MSKYGSFCQNQFSGKIAKQLNKDLNPVPGMVAKPSKPSSQGIFLCFRAERWFCEDFIFTRESNTSTGF